METIKNAIKWFFKTTFTVLIVFSVLIFFTMAFIAKISFDNIEHISIPENSYLMLSFPNGLHESPNEMLDITDFKISKMNQKNLIFSEVLTKISFAAKDSRIKGIILDLDNWNLTYQHTNEIANALKDYKIQNKSILAFGSGFNKVNYLAALSADEIIADPSNSSTILLNGMSVTVPYFKGLGDKLGIEVEVTHIGQFKGSGENYAKENMSEQFRASIEKIIDDRIDLLAEAISSGRGIEKREILDKISKGEMVFITPQEAQDMKLIDKLMSFDEFIREYEIGEKQIIDITKYENINLEEKNSRIAIIFAEGNIVDFDDESFLSEDVINPVKFERILKKIRKDKGIKAVVLRVNSPGGSAHASEKILRKLIDLKNDIPVIVSMGATAASGGYYISSHGTKIYADPYTITGSIGVVSMIPNVKKMFDYLGINNEKIVRGKYSDIFEFTKESSPDDTELLKHAMEKIYEEFKQRVSIGRNITPDSLEQIAQGQIWTGRQAKDNGLIDEIGGLNSALDEAARITGLVSYETVVFPENKTFSEKFFNTDEIESSVLMPFNKIGNFKKESEYIREILLFGKKPSLLMPVTFD